MFYFVYFPPFEDLFRWFKYLVRSSPIDVILNLSNVKITVSYCIQNSKRTHITHWRRVTHICVSKLIIIGSDNGLSPGRHQAIIWTNAGILLIGPLGTNFSEMLIEIHTFSFKKIHLKMSSGKWRPFCLGLNVITVNYSWWYLGHLTNNSFLNQAHSYASITSQCLKEPRGLLIASLKPAGADLIVALIVYPGIQDALLPGPLLLTWINFIPSMDK